MKNISLILTLLMVLAASCKEANAETQTSASTKKVSETQFKEKSAKPTVFKFGKVPSERNTQDTDGKFRRGVSLTNPPMRMADSLSSSTAEIIKDADKNDGKKVLVKGDVAKVCAKKGCWWMLKGDTPEQNIRVTAKDYGFFVPENATAMKATVWGTFKVKQLSAQKARHYAEDALEAGQKIDIKDLKARQEYSIVADGLMMEPKVAAPAQS